jgi:hypothetical protein
MIRAEEQRIQLFVNGVRTVDYTEREPGIDLKGLIALQIHGKCKAQIAFRNITIDALPDAMVPEEKDVLNRFGNPGANVAKRMFRFRAESSRLDAKRGHCDDRTGELGARSKVG